MNLDQHLAFRRKREFKQAVQAYSFSKSQIDTCKKNRVQPHTVKAVVESFVLNSITGDVSAITQTEIAKQLNLSSKTVNLAVKVARNIGMIFCRHQYALVNGQRQRIVSNTLINLNAPKKNNKFFEFQKIASMKKSLKDLVSNALSNQRSKKREIVREKKRDLSEDMEIIAVSSSNSGAMRYLAEPLTGEVFYGRLHSIANRMAGSAMAAAVT